MTIKFNSYNKQYSFLSNFFPAKITYQGIVYPTNEHAFHAMKSSKDQDKWISLILQNIDPRHAKRIGRQLPLRSDWNQVRDQIMEEINRAKYSQNPNLMYKLLATGDEELIEDASWDSYWGNGKDGLGQNKLGKILMKLREEFRK